jgi:hypothetical protein
MVCNGENTNSTILEVQESFGLTYMVGIIPLNLRSQEMDKGVPHARARRRRPGRAWHGMAWHLVHENRTIPESQLRFLGSVYATVQNIFLTT